MASIPRGSTFGRYRIESLIGRGGMSVVYLAEDIRLGRRVAIKVLAPELAADEDFRNRFVREAQLAASLDHPNIVPVYDAGVVEGRLFTAMRYVGGTDLRTLIAREGRLEPDRAIALLRQVAAALDAAHGRGLVHRDVKPENILIATDEGEEHVYLSDFGLTKHTTTFGFTQTGQLVGTVDYVAPEQIQGQEVDGRADEYSLACVLYECLTASVPYPRDSYVATLFGHINDPPPKVNEGQPDLPPALADALTRGMAKSPEDRFPSAGAFADAVGGALSGFVHREPSQAEYREAEPTMSAPVPTASTPDIDMRPPGHWHPPPRGFPRLRLPRVGLRLRPRRLGAPARYVNLWFTRSPGRDRVRKRRPLKLGARVYLQVGIGPFDKRTLLREARPFPGQEELHEAFPETRGKAIAVEVSIFTRDFIIPMKNWTETLPLRAGSDDVGTSFEVRPAKTGRAELRVCVFYQNHLLQSIGVVAIVSRQGLASLRRHAARVEITFTRDFQRAASLPERGLWVGVNQAADATHALDVKGVKVPPLRRSLDHKIEKALQQARAALLRVSFDEQRDDDGNVITDERTGHPKRIYRFDRENRPRAADEAGLRRRFRDDLAQLGRAGANLYDAVFGTGSVPTAEERPEAELLLRGLAESLRTSQVIQISRLKRMEDIWPWAMVYDLEIDPVRVDDVCLSFIGPPGGKPRPFAEGAVQCKHFDPTTGQNDPRIVCPYGFWGFKHIIEQPTQPGGKQAFADLVLDVRITAVPVLKMPVAAQLVEVEDEHVQRMEAARFELLSTYQAILDAFTPAKKPPEPHAMYFLCHGKYDRNGNFYLEVGEGRALTPSLLQRLNFSWSTSHGIVFINGCHTVDLEPKDLSNIMAPFLRGQASGIIGTEVSVHTFLAREFAQEFFERFLPNGREGQKAGEIIRDLRLELLAKFNPLGLAYTPYCSADLHMTK